MWNSLTMCKAIRILHDTLQASGNKGVAFGIALLFAAFLPGAQGFAESSTKDSGSFVSPIGYVTDLAGIVEPEQERKICDLASELERKTGIRTAILTTPSLDGYKIEDFAQRLLESWMPDPSRRAKTILLIDAPSEEKLRLEIGTDLDTLLSQEAANRVQNQVLLPSLRKGDKGMAYFLTITELAAEIADRKGITLYRLKGPGFLTNQPAAIIKPESAERDTTFSLWFLPVIMAALWIGYREARSATRRQSSKA
jgi:uncharacterized membrane protein YgcG